MNSDHLHRALNAAEASSPAARTPMSWPEAVAFITVSLAVLGFFAFLAWLLLR